MKLKKVLAALLASTMILGSAVTTFAAQVTDNYLADIEVHNLAENHVTTLDLYNLVYLDVTTAENGVTTQSWKVAGWANGLVTVDSSTGAVSIPNKQNLLDEVNTLEPASGKYHYEDSISETGHIFEDVPVGAYVVRASDDSGTYGLMVASTYDAEATYMQAKKADVYAKLEEYKIDKTVNDDFVGRGDTVTFTVKTQFPATEKENNDGSKVTLNTFEVVDTPEGLDITGISSITIGGTSITIDDNWIQQNVDEVMDLVNTTETERYTIDLSDEIGKHNTGEAVEIVYTAVVVDEDYNNSVDVNSNTVDYTPGETEGWTGKIKVTKVADDSQHTPLSGAEFQVFLNDSEDPISFVEVGTDTGVYRKALEEEAKTTTTVKVSSSGVLEVKDLADGTYTFKETKAPEGYSISNTPTPATITADKKIVEVGYGESDKINIVNTKLSSLPSTGGIGTTIFTIGGCVIMVSAAGLYFASRRRQENK